MRNLRLKRPTILSSPAKAMLRAAVAIVPCVLLGCQGDGESFRDDNLESSREPGMTQSTPQIADDGSAETGNNSRIGPGGLGGQDRDLNRSRSGTPNINVSEGVGAGTVQNRPE